MASKDKTVKTEKAAKKASTTAVAVHSFQELAETATTVNPTMESVRSLILQRRNAEEDRISHYLEEFLKNEGEQLNFVPNEAQLSARAMYVVSHRAIQDAVAYYGASQVLEAIAQAWWNSTVPQQWAPFFATLVNVFEWAWNEQVIISNSIKI